MKNPFSFLTMPRRLIIPALAAMSLFGLTCKLSAATLWVDVSPQYDSRALMFDKMELTNSIGQKLSVTRLDCLLSDIALHQKNGAWLEKTNWQAFLSVGEKRTSFDVDAIAPGDYDRIRFN